MVFNEKNTTVFSMKINKKLNFEKGRVNFNCVNCPIAKVK